MAVMAIGNYFAEWIPSGTAAHPGTGRVVLVAAETDEWVWLNDLHPEDYRSLLHLLQTERPIFWDSEARSLRTAHPESTDAAPLRPSDPR